MLNWRAMPEDEFNRIVEQLIRRSVMADNPGVDVKALDGRGGDGGIDLDARVERTAQLVAIYQLKYFPEGFSGPWGAARKPQIRKSFNAALQHDPPAWYLVVPRNLTPKERSFVRSLQERRRRPLTRYLGATELDALLVRFPDIEDWAQRDPLRTALERVGREQAALAGPGDLGREVMDLATRAGARSDYWGIDFSRVGDTYIETLVPLRPDASEREPLSATFTANFASDPELGAAFQHTMEFGGTEPLVLPADVVERFTTQGPAWFANDRPVSSLEFHPTPEVLRVPATVILRDSHRITARRQAASVRVVRGSVGGKFVVNLDDNIEFTFAMMHSPDSGGSLTVSSDLAGLSGMAAKRALGFLADLARAETVELIVDGRSSVASVAAQDFAPHAFQVELADDLAAIEGVLNAALRYPESIDSAVARIWVRVVRHILEGKVSLMPGVDGFNFVLSGETDGGLEGLLESGGSIMQTASEWTVDLLGQQVDVDDVAVLIADVAVADAAAHLEALRGGRGADRKVHVAAADGVRGVLIWSPSRIGQMEVLTPSPWNIEGVLEHRQLRTE